MITQRPVFLLNLIPYSLGVCNNYTFIRCKNNYLEKPFIPYAMKEWNKLITEIHKSSSHQQFRKSLLSFAEPTFCHMFFIYNHVRVKLYSLTYPMLVTAFYQFSALGLSTVS